MLLTRLLSLSYMQQFAWEDNRCSDKGGEERRSPFGKSFFASDSNFLENWFCVSLDSWRNFTCKDIRSFRSIRWATQHFITPVAPATKTWSDFSSLMRPTPSSTWLTTRKVKRHSTKRPLRSVAASATCSSPADPIYSFKTIKARHRKFWHSTLTITTWQLISKVSGMQAN